MPAMTDTQTRGNKFYGIAEEIKARIASGEYSERLPTYRELALEFETTQVTIRKTVTQLEKEGIVKPAGNKGILITRLQRQRTNTIGVMMGDLVGPLTSQLLSGIQKVAIEESQSLILEKNQGHKDGGMSIVKKLLADNRVDGFIIWPNDDIHDKGVIDFLHDQKVPLVLVPEPETHIYKDNHTVNAKDGSPALMEHLFKKKHRKILFAGAEKSEPRLFFIRRYHAYCEAMTQYFASPEEPLFIPEKGTDKNRLKILKRLEDATAVFCANDDVALFFLKLFLEEGIKVPKDIALVGYDNVLFAKSMGLTSIEQNFAKIGETAVKILIDEIEGKLKKPVHKVVPSELIERSSSNFVRRK